MFRAKFDIADVVRGARGDLESRVRLNALQRAALTSMVLCRTATLGGVIESCSHCPFQRETFVSCRNRHCPKCQAFAQEEWIERQTERTLDMQHFHLVFTVPAELRNLIFFAPKAVYSLMMRAVGQTLLDFGKRNWGATLGATLVLHTWNRELAFHPHVHAIVTGGGLRNDAKRMVHCPKNFIFPVKALKAVFRGKLIQELEQAYNESALQGFADFQDPEGFSRMKKLLFQKKWVVYAKPTFERAKHVLSYLGRYTHRVGISNSRITAADESAVTFRTRGTQTATFTPMEFTRRLTLHVLPKGFHKVRHIGLNASTAKRHIAAALIGSKGMVFLKKDWQTRLFEHRGTDLVTCPRCRSRLRFQPVPARVNTRASPVYWQLPHDTIN